MSERYSIEAQPRNVVGKQAKQLRREGVIPAVIYGQQDALTVQLDNLTLRRVLRHAGATNLIDIKLDGDTRTVLTREVQTHPTRGDLIHVDFYEVNLKVAVMAEAALATIGQSAPEVDGEGVTTQLLYSVEIEALPEALISELEVDLTRIVEPDDIIYVRDLPVPDGVTVLTDPDTVVAKFDYLRDEEEIEEAEGLASILEPDAGDVEVVGEEPDEEEEEVEE